jgi:hypothetical protein
MDPVSLAAAVLVTLLVIEALVIVRDGQSQIGIYARLDAWASSRLDPNPRAHARTREAPGGQAMVTSPVDDHQARLAARLLDCWSELAGTWRPEWGAQVKVERGADGQPRPRVFVRRARAWAVRQGLPDTDGDRALDQLLAARVIRRRGNDGQSWELVGRSEAVRLIRKTVGVPSTMNEGPEPLGRSASPDVRNR